MDNRNRILRLLSDGQWRSGEYIASALSMSRAAVWKHVGELNEMGLDIQAVRGRGYRLGRPLELLDASRIAEQLQGGGVVPQLDVLFSTDSTNQYLLSHEDRSRPRLCLAEYQSAGRGRRGRRWHSPFGGNLYMSLSWQFRDMPLGFGALGLAVGAGIAARLLSLGMTGVGLKWPNDVFWDRSKLGGVLIEHRGESGGPWHVVIGFGLNYDMGTASQVDQPWVDLRAVAAASKASLPGRNKLAGALGLEMIQVLQRFEREGFSPFREDWLRLDMLKGCPVRVLQGSAEIRGVAHGIDGDGALWVEVAGVRQRFISGEVSLRPA